jgi:PAS domain S-box-containing protein
LKDYFVNALFCSDQITLFRLEVLKTREPRTFENQFISGDRIIFFEIRAYPSFGGISVFTRDITERKVAEEALRESEGRLELALNVSQMGTWDLNLVNHMAWRSLRHDQIFGYESLLPEWTYEMFIGHVLAEDRAEVNRRFEEANSDRHDWEFECRIRRTDGEIRWIWAKGRIQYANQGDPERMLGLVHDITERKRAEDALRESEQRLNLAQRIAKVGDITLNVETGEVAWSDALYDLMQYDKSEKIDFSRVNAEIHHPDDLERVTKWLNDCIASGSDEITPNKYRIIRKDGKILFVHTMGVIHRGKGNQVKVFITLQDITEQKLAEEALRESEAKFRLLFNSQRDAVAVHKIGIDGQPTTFIQVNDVTCERLGYTREEMLKLRPQDIDAPDRAGQMPAIIEKLLKNKQVLFETEHISKDGRRIPVEVSTVLFQLDDCLATMTVARDITERKQVEKALRASEKKYRYIFEKSVSGLFKTSLDGHLIDANDALAHMYGYSDAAEMLKADLDIGTHFYANPDDRKEVIRILLEKGIVENYEIQHNKRDGTRFWGLITARTIRHEDDTVIFFEGSNIDISERKVAEEALHRANKKLNLLSSITRHDINNQLMVLTGFLSILQMKQADATLNEYFQKVSTAAMRISAMVQFTKEYEEIGVHAPAWQNCRTLVDTAVKQAPLGNVVVNNDLPDGTEVLADPLIVKVFYNLMDNAVRYGGKITNIRFSVEERDGDHVVVCEDDGDGVIDKEKEKIFDRGFGKNTGLGLALAREILSITGITITETGELGKGARFEIVVPKGAWRIIP